MFGWRLVGPLRRVVRPTGVLRKSKVRATTSIVPSSGSSGSGVVFAAVTMRSLSAHHFHSATATSAGSDSTPAPTAAAATAAAVAGGNPFLRPSVPRDSEQMPFYEAGMSQTERERVTRALGLFEDGNRLAGQGTVKARSEAIAIFGDVVSLDPKGAIGFRALIAQAAIHTAASQAALQAQAQAQTRSAAAAGAAALPSVDNKTNASIIDLTVRALQLLRSADLQTQRRILQLTPREADDAKLANAVADFCWGLRLNIGFQTISWLINSRVAKGTPEMGFLLVLLNEHFAPELLFGGVSQGGTPRTDPEALSLIDRARKAILAVSEYLKHLRMFKESERFAHNALYGLDPKAVRGMEWVAEAYFQIAAIRMEQGAGPDDILAYAHKALGADDKHWKSHALIGTIVLASHNDYTTALRHMQSAMSANPPREHRGTIIVGLGNALFAKAVAMDQSVSARGGPQSISTEELARITAEYQTTLDDAIKQFELGLTPEYKHRFSPEQQRAISSNLGAALMKRARTADAMKVLQSSATAHGDTASLPRLNLVFALMQQGPWETVEPELKSFIGVTRLPSGDVDDVDAKLVEAALTEGAKRLNGNPAEALKYFTAADTIMHATKTDAVVRRWAAGAQARIGLAHARIGTPEAYPLAVQHLEKAQEYMAQYLSVDTLKQIADKAERDSVTSGSGDSLDTASASTSASSPVSGSTAAGSSGPASGMLHGRGDPHCTPVSVWLALAQTHHMYRDMDKAKHCYESALACVPPPSIDDRVTTLYNLASLQLMSGAHGEAEAYLKQADMLKPEQPMILTLQAQTQFLLNRTDEALALLQRVHTLDPAYVEQYANLANVQLKRGDCHAALAAAQKSLQLDPAYQPARLHFTIGLSWIGLGRIDEGRAHLEHAQKLDPALEPTCKAILQQLPIETPPPASPEPVLPAQPSGSAAPPS